MVKNQSFPENSKHMYICKEWFKLIKKGFKYGVMPFSVQNDLKYLRYDATMEFWMTKLITISYNCGVLSFPEYIYIYIM